jgi:hypothetical protein
MKTLPDNEFGSWPIPSPPETSGIAKTDCNMAKPGKFFAVNIDKPDDGSFGAALRDLLNIPPEPPPDTTAKPQPPDTTANPQPPDTTAKDSVIALLAAGFWPVVIYPPGVEREGKPPTKGKEPIGDAWGAKRITLKQIDDRFTRHPDAGGGMLLGPGKGPDGSWPVDFEGDGPAAANSLLALFGGSIPDTMSWTSRRQPHRVYRGDKRFLDLLVRCKAEERKGPGGAGALHLPFLPDLEIRVGGWHPDGKLKQIQSVTPPTPGEDGVPRQ